MPISVLVDIELGCHEEEPSYADPTYRPSASPALIDFWQILPSSPFRDRHAGPPQPKPAKTSAKRINDDASGDCIVNMFIINNIHK
jgi:hypothetical protein